MLRLMSLPQSLSAILIQALNPKRWTQALTLLTLLALALSSWPISQALGLSLLVLTCLLSILLLAGLANQREHLHAWLKAPHIRPLEALEPDRRTLTQGFNEHTRRLQRNQELISQLALETAQSAALLEQASAEVEQLHLRQQDALGTLVSSSEQMEVSVNSLADMAEQSRERASHTHAYSQEGFAYAQQSQQQMEQVSQRLQQLEQAMGQLAQHTEAIRGFAEVIEGVAAQINLLALNAAIEAARAGDAGRGFAVVAAEVRSLAQHSDQASRDIRQLTNSLAEDVHQVDAELKHSRLDLNQCVLHTQQLAEDLGSLSEDAKQSLLQATLSHQAIREHRLASQDNQQRFLELAEVAEQLNAHLQDTLDMIGYLRQLSQRLNQFKEP
ncbi:methyl-accepting chemotaxis protein [Balneatrix alpica]|uniref:Methyl-accepting chemotaxis protein n=1 Tax=Balneatrix alpica TaxID=75684 RepID=A0ABV5Z7K4_9GAMM|nr:methyl-accepting chemotaxis protein [Balneatrix alpica]